MLHLIAESVPLLDQGSVQFILFAGIDAGVVLLLLRQRGIWQRVRSAPIRKGEFVIAITSAGIFQSG